MMINIGSALCSQGQLREARRAYEEAFDAAVGLGNKDIQGLAKLQLASIDEFRGDLDRAELGYQLAGKLFTGVADKTQLASTWSALGRVAMLKADFPAAQQLYRSALAMRQSSQQRVPIAESQLDLEAVSIETGLRSESLEQSMRRLVEEFREEKAVNDQAMATALLARILLMQQKRQEAQQTIQQAIALSANTDTNVQLSIAVAAAYIQAAVDQTRRPQILAQLQKTIARSRRLGFYGIELEGRLTFGEIEIQSGAIKSGRGRLDAVQKDASQHGFMLLAGKAGLRSADFRSSNSVAGRIGDQ